jgi:hypothetical protein
VEFEYYHQAFEMKNIVHAASAALGWRFEALSPAFQPSPA